MIIFIGSIANIIGVVQYDHLMSMGIMNEIFI